MGVSGAGHTGSDKPLETSRRKKAVMTSRAGVLRCAIVGFCVAAKIAAVESGCLGASLPVPSPAAPPPQPLPEVGDAMPCLNLITQDSCCDQWIGGEIAEVCCPDMPRPDGFSSAARGSADD